MPAMFSARPFTGSHFVRQTARQIARLLVVVLLLQFALPTWAAFSAQGKAGWIEVCAAGGIKWVKIAAPDATPADDSHASSDHCLLCAATGALNEFDVLRHLGNQGSDALAGSLASQVATGFAGHSILSRAPPFFV